MLTVSDIGWMVVRKGNDEFKNRTCPEKLDYATREGKRIPIELVG